VVQILRCAQDDIGLATFDPHVILSEAKDLNHGVLVLFI
jgi:hypothetical protein